MSRHITIIYLAFVVMYASHDLFPFMTGQENVKFGNLHLLRYSCLLVAGVLIPVLQPRSYAIASTSGAENSAFSHEKEKINSALTASYLSLSLYSFLDRLIIRAYAVPTLEMSDLPPVPLEDTAEFLWKKFAAVSSEKFTVDDRLTSTHSSLTPPRNATEKVVA